MTARAASAPSSRLDGALGGLYQPGSALLKESVMDGLNRILVVDADGHVNKGDVDIFPSRTP